MPPEVTKKMFLYRYRNIGALREGWGGGSYVVRLIFFFGKLRPCCPQGQLDRFMQYPKAAESMAEKLDK